MCLTRSDCVSVLEPEMKNWIALLRFLCCLLLFSWRRIMDNARVSCYDRGEVCDFALYSQEVG